LPAAQLLEKFGIFGKFWKSQPPRSQLGRILQLHKNLTIAAAAHGAAHSQLHRKFDMGARVLWEGHQLT